MKFILLIALGVAAVLAEESAPKQTAVDLSTDATHHRRYYRPHYYRPSYYHGHRWKRDTSPVEAPVEEGLEGAESRHGYYGRYPSYGYGYHRPSSYSYAYQSFGYPHGYRGKRDVSEVEAPVEEALEGAESRHGYYGHYPSYGYGYHTPYSYSYNHQSFGYRPYRYGYGAHPW
ncbi:shematrin-like protein 1 [Artemia franciscana]|uniref:shematrin-like protein 1 n=1 Tax=Artemia franciscana TaxID=6661 RepID=UPI0032D9E26C